jgi:hypothetical protein
MLGDGAPREIRKDGNAPQLEGPRSVEINDPPRVGSRPWRVRYRMRFFGVHTGSSRVDGPSLAQRQKYLTSFIYAS